MSHKEFGRRREAYGAAWACPPGTSPHSSPIHEHSFGSWVMLASEVGASMCVSYDKPPNWVARIEAASSRQTFFYFAEPERDLLLTKHPLLGFF